MDATGTPTDREKSRRHTSDGCKLCGEDTRCSKDDRTRCKLHSLSEDLCVVAGAVERIADAAGLDRRHFLSEDLRAVAAAAERIADAAARIHLLANRSGSGEETVIEMADAHPLPAIEPGMEMIQFANPSVSGEGAVIEMTDVVRRPPKRLLVDTLHINSMLAAYKHHFGTYSKSRNGKPVTQLIPGKVWKDIYAYYKKVFPTSPFQEESLKDRLRETLKDIKAGTLKVVATDKVALENEEGLVQSKSMVGQPNMNVLKRSHSKIDGTTSPLGASSSSASSSDRSDDAPPPVPGPASPLVSSSEKPMSEAQIRQQQASSHALMANQESAGKRNALLEAYSEAKLNTQKIANLRIARDEGVITDEEFKQRVKGMLRLEILGKTC